MHSLPVFLRLDGRPVMLLGTGDTAAAKRRLLERAGARIIDESATSALAIVAIEDEAEAEAAVSRLRARGILVNAVDRPALCDFTLPAIVDRDPVLIAIGTGGASAGMAKALRQRIEALFPASLGALADALHEARPRLRARFPDPTARRRAIDSALDPGGPLDPMAPLAAGAVERWLDSGLAGPNAAIVTIRLRSPDPDDLTIREARWLARADTLFHDGRAPAAILDRARADSPRVAGPLPDPPPAGISIVITMGGDAA